MSVNETILRRLKTILHWGIAPVFDIHIDEHVDGVRCGNYYIRQEKDGLRKGFYTLYFEEKRDFVVQRTLEPVSAHDFYVVAGSMCQKIFEARLYSAIESAKFDEEMELEARSEERRLSQGG
jgi:hypothetical protein